MTKDEIKQIERVFKKPISEIDKWKIPAYIRKRDNEKRDEEISYEDDRKHKYKEALE